MSLSLDRRSVTDFVSSSETDAPFEDALIAGGLAASVLLAQHVALWQRPWRLSRPASYALGTATLGVAFTWWSKRHGSTQAALAWWIIAGMGGSVVCTAYWLREALNEHDATAVFAGQVASRSSDPGRRY